VAWFKAVQQFRQCRNIGVVEGNEIASKEYDMRLKVQKGVSRFAEKRW
jgi:hypothetical protein